MEVEGNVYRLTAEEMNVSGRAIRLRKFYEEYLLLVSHPFDAVRMRSFFDEYKDLIKGRVAAKQPVDYSDKELLHHYNFWKSNAP